MPACFVRIVLLLLLMAVAIACGETAVTTGTDTAGHDSSDGSGGTDVDADTQRDDLEGEDGHAVDAADTSARDVDRLDTAGEVVDTSSPGDASDITPDAHDIIADAPDTVAAVCGDGERDEGEACDDGNVAADDYCAADCQTVTGRCGDGVEQANEACDDGNLLGGDWCSPDCVPTYPCGALGGSCAAVEASVTEHEIVAINPCAFSLDPPAQTNDALIDALVARAGGALTIADVFGDLNRDGVAGVTQQTADRLVNHAWQGFRWNAGDMDVTYWYPQGISTSSDAVASGRVAGRRALLVSWYHKTDERPTKGVRVSLADISDLNNVTYRHLLLVEPFDNGGTVDIGPAQNDYGDANALHAGGIVWYGDYLYVADTAYGLRVFDLSRIIQVSNTDDTARIGVTDTRVDAHGYRYAVPQLARYELSVGSCPLRFSFAGLDRSTDPPRIVTGEYHSGDPNGRLAAWQIDPATGLLDARQGEVRAVEAYIGAQTRMQGGLTLDGNVYISSSSQTASSFGRLYRTRPGRVSSISAWPYGCEDLSYERDTTVMWTAAEHPGTRDVVGIPLLLP